MLVGAGLLLPQFRFFPTMFQINYADGLARPDTTIRPNKGLR